MIIKQIMQDDNTFLEIRDDILFEARTYYKHSPHFHNNIEIVFMLDGNWTTRCNGKNYTLTPGTVFIAPANSIHSSIDHNQASTSLLLVVNPTRLMGLARQLDAKSPSSLVWQDPEKKSFIWEAIQYVYRNKNNMTQTDLLVHLSSIISIILAEITLEDNLQEEKIGTQILKYCQQHYTDDITLSTLASALHISKSHISHTFSNIIGISFPQYINNLRLANAEYLLVNTKKSCSQVALESGFSSSRTFNIVFKQKHNIAPLAYRKLKQK